MAPAWNAPTRVQTIIRPIMAPERAPKPQLGPEPGPGAGPETKPARGRRRRRRSPLWARLGVAFGVVLLVLSGGALAGAQVLIGRATQNIAQGNLLGDGSKSAAEGGASMDGAIDMLLLGVDVRESWEENNTRADTIVILHIPATHDRAFLISVPRDTLAEIPPLERNDFAGATAKINDAFYYGAQNGGGWAGGAQLMAETLKGATGIGFDGAAIIDFGGFKNVIDELGGVRMCVDERTVSHHMVLVDGEQVYKADARRAGKRWAAEPVVYGKGCQQMNGTQALDFSRQRYGLSDGDYGRQRHQQQMIKAIVRKAASSGITANPLRVDQLIQAAGTAFTLDTGGIPVADFIFTLKGVAVGDLMTLNTNGGRFNPVSVGGTEYEQLSDLSQRMFEAVREDRLTEFVIENPEVISRS
ncbi:LCP family protein required for cell wall assembly [Catenuloplanes nepalensis]|uniref:LCP family protein required for cell wall assembly n=1 Tax=Catenuloplanes nepalensis TaxID=587533 RepID=A0ABT9N587_9ACTN|nr:LCP family protein [Catenuloplanes nepalensis]MDP9798586.1 LCP family protein required for cell wall assembly [Catenuloplanes nepalensis]